MTDPPDDDKRGPRTETRQCCAHVALTGGGIAALVVAVVDIWGDGDISAGHAALKDLYPPLLLAASLILVLLKLIATFPEWSDARSKAAVPWIKFIADAVALAAAAYAALIAGLVALLPTIMRVVSTPTGAMFSSIFIGVIFGALINLYLRRQDMLKSESQQEGSRDGDTASSTAQQEDTGDGDTASSTAQQEDTGDRDTASLAAMMLAFAIGVGLASAAGVMKWRRV